MSHDTGRDLHLPAGSPIGAAVVLHPHPTMGGDRHHPMVVALAEGLAADGVAALRVDLRDPDVASSAKRLESIATDLVAEVDTYRLVLVGYSWGSAVCAAAAPVGLVARVLVAPPVGRLGVDQPPDGLPALVLVPEHDQYGGPEAVAAATDAWPDVTVDVIAGIDHFLAGAIAEIAGRTVTWVADQRS